MGTIAEGMVFYAACGLVPAAILVICLAATGIYPFGNVLPLSGDNDLAYQYANLLAWLQNVLFGDANLLYSQGKSLGGNMFATYSYYVASPLNLLLVFFPQGAIEDFFFFLWLLRTALCGIAIAVFVRRRLPDVKRSLVLALAICYSLCQYNIVQATNIMWLDAPILMPLIALGAYRFVSGGRIKLFVVTLALSIWSCWYTGYMTVIASLFIFVLEYWLQANGRGGKFSWRALIRKLIRFGLVLLLVAATTMVILAPSVYGLLSGKGDSLETASKIVRCWPWDFFTAVLPLNFKYNFGRPQLFCGTFALGAVLLLLFTRKVPKHDRVAFAVILFVLLLCMFFSPLERVWTGFTDGNNYYCRWSFVVEFFIVFAAAYALNGGLPNRKEALRVLVCLIVLGVIGFALHGFSSFRGEYFVSFIEGELVTDEFALACFSFFTPLVCFAVFLVTCLGLFAIWALAMHFRSGQGGLSGRCSRNFGKTPHLSAEDGLPTAGCRAGGAFAQKAAAVFFVLLVSADLGINALPVLVIDHAVCHNIFNGEYTQYNSESAEGLASLEAADSDLYRIDKTYSVLHDHSRFRAPTSESLALGYMPLSSYLSTSDTTVSRFMGNMGYMARQGDADGVIQGTFPAAVVPSDSLLGLRYVATADPIYGYEETGIEAGTRGKSSDGSMHYWYKNADAFPLAFGVGAGATAFIEEQSDAFTYQNKLFQALFDTDEQMYTELASTKVSSDDSGVRWTVDQDSTSDLCYAEVRSTKNYKQYYWEDIQLSIGSEPVAGGYYRAFTYGIVPTGSVTAGEEISLTGLAEFGSDSDMTLYIVQANKDLLDSFTERANAKAATFNEFRDGYVSASYTASADDAYLFTSIPYDAGWTVKVNGQQVQPELVGDCLMAIPVTEGQNDIELSYCSPLLVQGAVVSGLAWAGIIAFIAVRAYRCKRAAK